MGIPWPLKAMRVRRWKLIRGLRLLRSEGISGQGVRFALSGAVVSVLYIAITTLLSTAFHMNFQVALVIGWSTAVIFHFILQRVFVWANHDEYALSLARQVRRYLFVAGYQLGLTAVTTATLPSTLGVSTEAIYLGTATLLSLTNFLVFRHGVFHVASADRLSALGG